LKEWKYFFTGRISLELLHAVARAFDCDVTYFDKFLDDRSLGGAGSVSTFRLNFYPQLNNPTPVSTGVDDGEPLSCEEHYDGCLLTLLYQHEVGGLQIQLENRTWIDVPVVPYGLAVNTGKCLERWTNGCLKAVRHRVKLLKEERLSVPFFFEPSFSTPITPLATAGGIPKYDPINYGQYITESNKKFKEYQRDDDNSS
jgi:isopenicillin N synthase-like dioxygenase